MDRTMEEEISLLSKYQISRFFGRNAPITQQQCDEEAERILGASVLPTTMQGASSYTVFGGTFVIQFRDDTSPLDADLLGLVEQAYAGFVPHHESAGKLGKLHIYKMNMIGGVSMYLARDQLQADDCNLLRRTLQGYARFFASPWKNTPAEMPRHNQEVMLADYSSKLSQLSQGLPERFRATLEHLIASLPRLFAQDWPFVPNHIDLLENNIHVDPATGRLVGICDWRDAEISPFGMSLGGIETLLGVDTVSRWVYHANESELRALFWSTFYEATGFVPDTHRELIQAARLVGLFLQHGFEYDENGNKSAASAEARGLAFIDAVLAVSSQRGVP
ncbi:hypothetical protein HGRIS_000674 [Hohenbuehelia grisea]|uniref:Aminoglycoside phosphotransferase domain-containing protein n=1 Tax=Hohenbuehelia grisea TaxID=104357 RepID=A0ABR3JRP2_9AGAR